MFFKMLKSDLKQNRGLNVILFLFSIIAAAFVFTGAVQIFANLTQSNRTAKACNTSDIIVAYRDCGSETLKQMTDKAKERLPKLDCVDDFIYQDAVTLEKAMFDFPDFDDSSSMELTNYICIATTDFPKYDLIYDTDDNRIAIKNGTISVPVSIANETGSKIGDKLRITTPLGNIYEFEIAAFTKEPLYESDSVVRFILSENDYKVISQEFPLKSVIFSISLKGDNEEAMTALHKDMKDNFYFGELIGTEFYTFSDSGIIMYVLSVFLIIISLFIILIIFMTIRFTIIAALKSEEKEIGVMRAMGVDSFGFRWMFAAKYIFFAIVGGFIGMIAGFPLADLLTQMFSKNYTAPSDLILAPIGLAAVSLNTLLIIFFSLRVMKRINKISVIDAIHGENKGERFGKGSVIKLASRKKMSVPFFLALSDILSRAKRYLFLVIAYTLGFLIVLMIFNIKNTVISADFLKYMNIYQMDFYIDLYGEDVYQNLMKRCEAENKTLHQLLNSIMEENDIPAEVDNANISSGIYHSGKDDEKYFQVYTGIHHPEKLNYHKGSRVPELPNEVAVSYFTARKIGLNIGDTITLDLPKLTEDKTTYEHVDRDFIITGFIDLLEGGGPVAVLGGEQDLYTYGEVTMAMMFKDGVTDTDAVMEQLGEAFDRNIVMVGDDFVVKNLSEYNTLFTLLEIVMGGAVLIITILITYLYQNIFLGEETAEIALLKSIGYTDGDITLWQLFRMMLLGIVSVGAAELIFNTVGSAFVNKLFGFLQMSGFGFVTEIPFSFIIMPITFFALIIVTVLFRMRSIGNIAVWNISNE